MNGSDDPWELQQQCLQAACELLIRNGWAKSLMIDETRGVTIEYLPKGTVSMKALWQTLRALNPETMRTEEVVGLHDLLIQRHGREETPPRSS